LRGHYPDDMVALLGPLFPPIQPGDMEAISTPIDFLGVNYYSRSVVKYDPDSPFIQVAMVRPEGNEYSEMWEIYPPGIYELLARIQTDYQLRNIYITENGIPVPDVLTPDRKVHDQRRIRYIRDHLAQLQRAIADDVPVRGYFAWSMLDNFEWAHGYKMRFGLVYVDFATQQRTIKDSGRWYAQVARDNGIRAR